MNTNTRLSDESETIRLYNSLDETGKAIALNIAETITAALLSAAKIQIAAANSVKKPRKGASPDSKYGYSAEYEFPSDF